MDWFERMIFESRNESVDEDSLPEEITNGDVHSAQADGRMHVGNVFILSSIKNRGGGDNGCE